MIKALKLRKAIITIVIGVFAVVVAQVMAKNNVNGSKIALGIAGGCFILGAILFLYPILFAKKIDNDGSEVELEPVEKKTGKV
ncbi:MAG: isoleucyl-tRNA synthetase [Pedobacter sp.]|nr:MAG: isoleucyl-tRNA synthetase [Pedobacter sp.]